MKKTALILILLAGLIVPLACTNSNPTGPLATYDLTATFTITFTPTATNWGGYTSTPTPRAGTNTATPLSTAPIFTATPTATFVITGVPSQPTPSLNGVMGWSTGAPPNGLAYDGSATIYVAEGVEGSTGGSIQMFTTTGSLLGTQTGVGSHTFSQPNGVAYFNNYLYVVDEVNNAVYQINLPGWTLATVTPLTSWTVPGGAPAGAPSSFLQPEGIAVDAGGNVYVADTNNGYVEVFNPSLTTALAEINGSTTPDGLFNNPSAVAVGFGNIDVVDASNQYVKVFNSSTYAYVNEFGTGVSAASDIYGITLDGSGDIYLADSGAEQVEEYSTSYGFLTSGLGNSATAPDPVGLVFIGSNLVLADYFHSQIYSVTP